MDRFGSSSPLGFGYEFFHQKHSKPPRTIAGPGVVYNNNQYILLYMYVYSHLCVGYNTVILCIIELEV